MSSNSKIILANFSSILEHINNKPNILLILEHSGTN